MTITHGTPARNAATDAVVDLIDAQTGAGKAVFRIAGSTVAAPSTAVATITLNDPAFGASSGGTATLDVDPALSDTNAAGGTIAFLTLQDASNNIVIHATVAETGTAGEYVDMTSGGLVVTAGDTVSITSLTYTALSA